MATETGRLGGEGEAVPPSGRATNLLDVLGESCYPLYERLLADRRDFVLNVDTKLGEALRDTNVELFLSRSLGIGLVAGLLAWLLGLVVGYVATSVFLTGVPTFVGIHLPPEILWLVQAAKIPALIVLSGLVFGVAGFAVGFGIPLVSLYLESYNRTREIDLLLPDTISFMYALSVGGMNHIEILDSVANAEEVYGEVAREFQTIIQETNYLEVDYRTAIHNRAVETPSEPLNQFLTDMLSVVNSGGDMTRFFEEKADRHLEIAKQRQEETLDTLELLGEMYLAVSLFPLLLIILLVVMSMVGQASQLLMYLTVYGLIPLIGIMFMLLIAMIKQDTQTSGYLSVTGDGEDYPGRNSLLGRETKSYRDHHSIFQLMDREEIRHHVAAAVRNPHRFFVRHPLATLVITVPVTAAYLGYVYVTGVAPGSVAAVVDRPVVGTVLYVYLPLYLLFMPLAVFHELYVRHRFGVMDTLTETLRKLSSANDTGLTLLESFRTVSETSTGQLAEDFNRIYVNVTYGTRLRRALFEFNNRYHVPRLSRLVKLVAEAQETSSQVTEVLTTAAQASKNQEEIERSRRMRTRIQITIIIMTFLTMLGVMAILKIQFLDVITNVVAAGGSQNAQAGLPTAGNVNVSRLSLLFLHTVTLQAIVSSFIAGYLRSADLLSGTKYMVALLTVAISVWLVVA